MNRFVFVFQSLLVLVLTTLNPVKANADKLGQLEYLDSHIEKLQSKLAEKVKGGEIVGALLGIVDVNGPKPEITYYRFGKTNLGANAASVDSNTLFEIGSITKTFVGLALGVLASEGKVHLDDPVSKYIPELKAHEAGSITLRELASHSSGLPYFRESQIAEFSRLKKLAVESDHPIEGFKQASLMLSSGTPDEVFKEIENSKIDKQRQYSNVGSGLLGYILVKATESKNLDEFLEKVLLKRLGVTSTSTRLPTGVGTKYAQPHLVDPELKLLTPYPWEKQQFGPMDEGAGALLSTGEDLAKLLVAELEPNSVKSSTLREALIRQQEEHTTGREVQMDGRSLEDFDGLGLTITKSTPDIRFYEKQGGTLGSTSDIMWNRDLGRGVVLMVNGANFGGSDVGPLINELYGALGATPEVLKKVQAEQRFLSTYKALHLGGDETRESRILKNVLRKDMISAIQYYLKAPQNHCGSN